MNIKAKQFNSETAYLLQQASTIGLIFIISIFSILILLRLI